MSDVAEGYRQLLADLVAEHEALDGQVAGLAPEEWRRPTPAQGWDVRDQIGHLAKSEDLATLAATDAEQFAAALTGLLADVGDTERGHLDDVRTMAPEQVLKWWRASRAATVAALSAHDADDRLPWAVGAMSAMSFATARLMETWAHGQDVVDAIGVDRPATARLRHVATLGVRTRRFSFVNRGLPVPDSEPSVELEGPDGARWVWPGSPDVRVTGPALDFCLVVTQRRHLEDTRLHVVGQAAAQWMAIAQAFAGPPTSAPAFHADGHGDS